MSQTKNNILITGNRKGIGRYLSEYYLEKGHNVIGCSRSDSDLNHKNYIHFFPITRILNRITNKLKISVTFISVEC